MSEDFIARAHLHNQKIDFTATTQDRKVLEEALAAFDQAIKLNPDDAETHAYRCYMLCKLVQFSEAKKAWRKAHQLGYDSVLFQEAFEFLRKQKT